MAHKEIEYLEPGEVVDGRQFAVLLKAGHVYPDGNMFTVECLRDLATQSATLRFNEQDGTLEARVGEWFEMPIAETEI